MRLSGQKKAPKKEKGKAKKREDTSPVVEEEAVGKGLSFSVNPEDSGEAAPVEEPQQEFVEETPSDEAPSSFEEAPSITPLAEESKEELPAQEGSTKEEEKPKKRVKGKKTLIVDDDVEEEDARRKKKNKDAEGKTTFKDVVLSLVETTVAAAILGVVGYQLGSLYLGELLQGIFGL